MEEEGGEGVGAFLLSIRSGHVGEGSPKQQKRYTAQYGLFSRQKTQYLWNKRNQW